MEYVLAVTILVALVAAVVLRPLLLGVGDDSGESASREELEAAKEAKYREIRDAQLDLEMGKLSEEDHRAVDRELRAEAIEILKRLDGLEEKASAPPLR
jgi:hypothetical protein